MTTFFSKHMCRLIAGTLAVSSLTMIQAVAAPALSVRLSPNVKAAVGTVLTAEDVMTAEQAFSRAQKVQIAPVVAPAPVAAATTPSAVNTVSEQARKDAEANTQAATTAQEQLAAVEKSREEALRKAKAKEDERKKEQEIARAKQEAEAAAKAEAESKAIAAQDLSRPYDRIVYEDRTNGAIYNSDGESVSSTSGASTVAPEIECDREVGYSSAFSASDDVADGATLLGNFKLTFYCPCEVCNGRGDAKTSSGTTMVEGRTIAVDSSIIPLGSRVYIEGYGEFIAEDTGSAIIDKRIDICVSTHERAYSLGVASGDVYLLS